MTEEDRAQWQKLLGTSSGTRRNSLVALAGVEQSLTTGEPLDPANVKYLLAVCRRARAEHDDPLWLKRKRGRQATDAKVDRDIEIARAVEARRAEGDSVEDAVAHVEQALGRPVQGTGGVVHKAYYKWMLFT